MNLEYIEATSQVSDAVSFIFVTPEFLGEDVLTSIRTRLLDTARRVLSV